MSSSRGAYGGRGRGDGRGPRGRRSDQRPEQTSGGRGVAVSGGRGRGNAGRGSSSSPPSDAVVAADLASSSATSVQEKTTKVPEPDPGLALSQGLAEKVKISPVTTLPAASSKAVTHLVRPGFGQAGKKIMIRANHFLVQVSDRDLYHYDTCFVTYGESHLGKRAPAYDGRKSLFTAGPEFFVDLKDGKDAASSSRKERQFRVAIKLASRPDLFLQRQTREAPYETIRVVDVVLRDLPSQEYVTLGRSFFDPTFGNGKTVELGDAIEYWRSGYFHSLRLTQMGLSLNVDVSARSFYEPVLVTEFISKFMYMRDFNRPLKDSDRVKAGLGLPDTEAWNMIETIAEKQKLGSKLLLKMLSGERILTAAHNGTIEYDDSTGEQMHKLKGHTKWIRLVEETTLITDEARPCCDLQPLSRLTSLASFLTRKDLVAGASIKELRKSVSKKANTLYCKHDLKCLGKQVAGYFKNDEPALDEIYYFSDKKDRQNGVLKWTSSPRDVKLNPGDDHKRWEAIEATGPVRQQGDHSLCSAYAATDLVSSARLIDQVDEVYQTLSVKEICFLSNEPERRIRAQNPDAQHHCPPMSLESALNFIQNHGVSIETKEEERFDCKTDMPKRTKKNKLIKIKGHVVLGDRQLKRIIDRLYYQPIGASVACFEPEFGNLSDGLYTGPTSNASYFDCFHSVEVVSTCKKEGKLAFKCKSSNGVDHYEGGFFYVCAATMLLGFRFTTENSIRLGIRRESGGDISVNKSKDEPYTYCLEEAVPLISGFICPELSTYETLRAERKAQREAEREERQRQPEREWNGKALFDRKNRKRSRQDLSSST